MLTGDDMMEMGMLNWLCPLSSSTLHRLPFYPSLLLLPLFLPSILPHPSDAPNTRCQIISQQTLHCVTENSSCISLDDTFHPSLPPTPLLTDIKYQQAFFDHLKDSEKKRLYLNQSKQSVSFVMFCERGHMCDLTLSNPIHYHSIWDLKESRMC